MKKCLIIGSCVADVIVYIDHLPHSQEDIHPSNQIIRLGGCAYNVVHVLHHLDIPYTLISPVGKGMYGDFVRSELNKVGIKTSINCEAENGCCYCFVEKDGERTFMSYHGVEYTFDPSWLNELNLDDYHYLYLCGLEVEDINGEELVNSVMNFNRQIIFAPGPRGKFIKQDLMHKLYNKHVILHVNDLEAMELANKNNVEEAASVLYSKTHNLVVVTCGASGTYYFDGQGHWVVTTSCKVADTLGAGDSHVGSLISALASDKDIATAINFANKVAGRVVSVKGPNLPKDEYIKLKELLNN